VSTGTTSSGVPPPDPERDAGAGLAPWPEGPVPPGPPLADAPPPPGGSGDHPTADHRTASGAGAAPPPRPDSADAPPPQPGAPDEDGAPPDPPADPGDHADTTPYDDAFFRAIDPQSYASARVVVARVLGLTGARSIVDVGCGSGAWIRACRDLGVPEVVGVDGAHVPAEHRRQATEFIERDLERPLEIDRRFSLVLCLEVAEHLPADRAPGFVADLTSLAPVVLFSAAVPGQGGTNHVNEQWSEYWVALFEAQGWTCRDAVRPWVRANEDVAWWYRQNLFLAVAPTAGAAYSSFPQLDAERIPNPVDYVRRPRGDVMEPPLGPAPAPAVEAVPPAPPAAWPDPEPASPPPVAKERDPAHPRDPDPRAPEARTGEPGTTEPRGADRRSAERNPATAEDGIEHPKPPGWDAMRRAAGRLRRRH